MLKVAHICPTARIETLGYPLEILSATYNTCFSSNLVGYVKLPYPFTVSTEIKGGQDEESTA